MYSDFSSAPDHPYSTNSNSAVMLDQSTGDLIYTSPPYMFDFHANADVYNSRHHVQSLQPDIYTDESFNAHEFNAPSLPFYGAELYVARTTPMPMDIAASASLSAHRYLPTEDDLMGVNPQATCPGLPSQFEADMGVFDNLYGTVSQYNNTRSSDTLEQPTPMGAATAYQWSNPFFNPALSHPAYLGLSTEFYNNASVAASPAASNSSHATATISMFSDDADSDDLHPASLDNDDDGNHLEFSFSFLHSDDFTATASEKPETHCISSAASPATSGASEFRAGAPHAPQQSQSSSRPPARRQGPKLLGPDDPLRVRADGGVECNLGSCTKVCNNKSDLRRHREKEEHSERQYTCSLGCGVQFTRVDGMLRHVKNNICLKPRSKKIARGGSGGARKKGRASNLNRKSRA